jgi:carbon-monoxide dehydrogenase iron sulfur subunit
VEKALVVNIDSCSGCRLCELACSFEKTKEFNPKNSRISVHMWPKTAEFVPVLCHQCVPAPCMKACQVPGAMTRDPKTNAVIINPAECVNCGVCMTACPYGGIGLDKKGVVFKCDLCGGEPKCVSVCPPRAIIWSRPDIASNVIKQISADKLRAATKRSSK